MTCRERRRQARHAVGVRFALTVQLSAAAGGRLALLARLHAEGFAPGVGAALGLSRR